MLLSALAVVALQQPVRPPAPVQDPRVGLRTFGIEAPDQPGGSSTSTVFRPERIIPVPARGNTGGVQVRIGDLVAVRGQEDNVIQGVGLVTGLNGTGDSGVVARQALINFLQTQNIIVDQAQIASKNVALVTVEAVLPPGIKPGRRVDIRVASWGDATSLVGGSLLQTVMTDSTGTLVYGTAAGPVTVGGFSAQGEGASVQRNHPTVGTVPYGGKVEREIPSEFVNEHGYIYLDSHARKGSFANVVRMVDAINAIYPGFAEAVDGMTAKVVVPIDLPTAAHVDFLDSILRLEIEPDSFARVVVNERTGVIVMGEGVRITRGAVTKGNITVTIAETPEASQPGAFSDGSTENLPRTDLLVEEEDRALTIVNGAADLQEVVEVLNVLGVTPIDMIQILQAMNQSGMLHAEVVSL